MPALARIKTGDLQTHAANDDCINGGPGTRTKYGYDALDRLTSAVKTGTTRGWTYDANGNRLTQTGTGAATYTMNSANNRVSSISGGLTRTYGYDNAGDVLTYSNVTATYNNRGRMKTLKVGSSTETIVYNALGERIKISGGGPGTVLYWYDEAGHLLGEYSSTGALVQETIWMGDIPVATIRPGAPALIYYVHTDHLNTPRRVTKSLAPPNNTLMWTWCADPFGSELPNENPASGGTFKYNLRFPGQLYDSHAGLNQNYFRDYDPAIGRYVESDLVGLRGGLNTYSYATSNPTMRFDSNGLTAISVDVAAGLMLVDPEVAGRSPYQMPITSGRDQCTNKPQCAPDRNRGPIPPGGYVIRLAELSDPGVIHDLIRQFRGDWGDWRVPIHRLPRTNTHDRSGFFLHGGTAGGSAGCVDFGGGVFGTALTDQLRTDLLNDPDGVVPFYVH